MSQYTLIDNLYLYPTPVGTYYAVSSTEQDKPRKFLNRLLQQPETPMLTADMLMQLTQMNNEEKALELLHHCQKLGWIQGLENKLQVQQNAMEDIFPELLDNISETGKVLLADDQGFYLVSKGFAHEVAEELSALSAEMATVHQRRAGLLTNNLAVGSHAWAIVDAFGHSQIGFWPVFIGKNRFVIVISGIPHFNQAEFVTLIWALSIRYAN